MNNTKNNILKTILFFSIILLFTFGGLFGYYLFKYNVLANDSDDIENLYFNVSVIDELTDPQNKYQADYMFEATANNLGDSLLEHSDIFDINNGILTHINETPEAQTPTWVGGWKNNFWCVYYKKGDDFIQAPVGIMNLNFLQYSNVFQIKYTDFN
ncbi:hypothetical protein [Spiroplasma endosymbiont of Amphibalanus improvisus]|uniref:hypothetical protein n=1 Tax=Spiroplasma endosymbiont of Amphibalanus improvisus TaxID=3066327 RepID=UPI00313B64A3